MPVDEERVVDVLCDHHRLLKRNLGMIMAPSSMMMFVPDIGDDGT